MLFCSSNPLSVRFSAVASNIFTKSKTSSACGVVWAIQTKQVRSTPFDGHRLIRTRRRSRSLFHNDQRLNTTTNASTMHWHRYPTCFTAEAVQNWQRCMCMRLVLRQCEHSTVIGDAWEWGGLRKLLQDVSNLCMSDARIIWSIDSNDVQERRRRMFVQISLLAVRKGEVLLVY